MAYQYKGVVTEITQTETIQGKNGNSFTKQTIVFDAEISFGLTRVPNILAIEFSGKLLEAIDKVQVGKQYVVDFDINGRKWNDKYFTTLRGFRIAEVAAELPPAPPAPQVAEIYPPRQQSAPIDPTLTSDLPF